MARRDAPVQTSTPAELRAWLAAQWAALQAEAPDTALHAYALVDVAKLSADEHQQIARGLSPDVEGINLYGDMAGLALEQSGPRMMPLSQSTLALACEWSGKTHALSYLMGRAEMEAVAHHLQGLREVTLPDDAQALFRFQDVNVTSHLFGLLSPGLINAVLGPLSLWAVPDVCGSVHVLRPRPGYQRLGGLRFDRRTFDQLDEALFVFTVADQVREVDTSLLAGLTPCQVKRTISQRLGTARTLGLTERSDQALHVVLSFQLQEGFEREEPFASAIKQARSGSRTFGEAVDAIPQSSWDQWNAKHPQ